MKKAKALTAMILAGILAIGSVTVSFAGPAGETGARGEWHQDANGWWFQYPNTIYPANMWEFINGSMATGIISDLRATWIPAGIRRTGCGISWIG